MALAMMGGLIAATILTLTFLPALYALAFRMPFAKVPFAGAGRSTGRRSRNGPEPSPYPGHVLGAPAPGIPSPASVLTGAPGLPPHRLRAWDESAGT
jgi:hypothetical protein